MPFISSNSGDSSESSEDKIEFVTEPQLQVIRAFNLTMDRLLPAGQPSVCLKCGAPTERLVRADLDNKIFSCTVQLPACARCSQKHPFTSWETNRIAIIAGLMALLSMGLIFASQILAGLIGIAIAAVFGWLMTPHPWMSRRNRQAQLFELLKSSDRYCLIVNEVPDTKLTLPDIETARNFSNVQESSSLNESFGWHSDFRWGVVAHDFSVDTASIPVLSALLEILVEEMTEFAYRCRNGKEVAMRLHLELLEGGRRTLNFDIIPEVAKQKVAELEGRLNRLPPMVVNGPIVVHLFVSTHTQTKLYTKLPAVKLSDEVQKVAAEQTAARKAELRPSDLEEAAESSLDAENEYQDDENSESYAKFSIEELLTWQKAAPRQLHLLNFIADRLVDLSRTAEALELWEGFMVENDDMPGARFQFAVFLERAEYLERAASVCQKLVELEPGNTDAFGLLAHLLLQLEQPENAATILQRAPIQGRTLEFYVAEARVFNALGDKEELWKTLELMKERFPEAAATWYLRAMHQTQQERYREALDDVDQLEKVAGTSWNVIQLRSHLLYQMGQIVDAMKVIDDALEQQPDDIALRLLRAEYFYGLNKFEMAIEDCLRVVERVPEYPYAHQLLAATYLENGDYDAAISSAQKAIDLSESTSYLMGLLGSAHLMKQEDEIAESYLIQACEADPSNIQARYRLSQLRANQGDLEKAIEELNAILTENPKHSTVLLTRGYNYLSLRDYERANSDFTLVIELMPKSLAGLRGKAIALEALDRRKEALSFYDQALEVDPEDADSLVGRSRLRMSDNNMEAAERDLNSVLESMPDSIQALYMRAQVNMHSGKLDQAISDFDEILKNNPDFTPALIGRSAVWNQKGEIEKSQDDLDAAIQSAPEQAEESDYSRLLQIAHLAFVQEKYDETIAAANEAIAASDEHTHAIRIRAGAYWYLDQFAEALDDYDHLIKASETRDPGLLNGRGQVYCELGEFELALADLKEAVELARKSELNTVLAYTLNGLGKTLTGLGRYEEAQVAFDESYSLQPKNAWLHFNQGLMAAVRHQPAIAVEFFKKALELTDPALSPKKRAKAKAYIDRYASGSQQSE
jgi:tetratricopeptide (TPR) repeat protein